MPPGISSTATMAKKKSPGGGKQPRNDNAPDGRNDRDKGDHIPITEPLFLKLKEFVESMPTQKAAAAELEVSEGTITNVLKTKTQKTFKRDLYVRVCKRLGMSTGSPLEQLVAVAGDVTADEIAFVVEVVKKLKAARQSGPR